MPATQTAKPERRRRSGLDALAVPLTTEPMEAKLAEALPQGPGWQFEPKWDGFRCLAFRSGEEVELRAKSGKPLTRYFPEMAAFLASLPAGRFVLDGELAIPVKGAFRFDALQLRLHPAESRVRRLAAETPSVLIAFDLLMDADGRDLRDRPLAERRAALEVFHAAQGASDRLRLSPATSDRSTAQGWLDHLGGQLDGVMAKRLDEPYRCGERAMLKVKAMRTADCVVGGFRYLKDSSLVGSLLLGLYDDEGRLNHVGFTSTIANDERAELTLRLEALAGGAGFTGRAPGGPSRWSTDKSSQWTPLKPELVVEVRYDHVSGDRIRHGARLLRLRPDKAPAQCRMEQISG
jgi:ATP-dependent DNA ligase